MRDKKIFFLILLIINYYGGVFSLSRFSPDILIMGDSHAFGLKDSIKEIMGDHGNLTLKGISSSGLVRDDFFNWIEWSGQLDKEYDYVFVILGTNDGQNINSSSPLKFGTREWEIFYSAKIEQLLARLSPNKKIFWITIPPVKSDDFSRKTEYIQSIIAEVCQFYHIQVLDVGVNLYNDGDYYLQEDGVHLTEKGYRILFQSILDEINKLTYNRLP